MMLEIIAVGMLNAIPANPMSPKLSITVTLRGMIAIKTKNPGAIR